MNSLGNKSSHNVNTRLRGTHPSYLGYLDINAYSSSSPGLSGSLVPMADTDGLYFDNTPEPQNKEFELNQVLTEQSEKEGKLVVYIGGKDAIKYYDAKYQMMLDCEKFKVEPNYQDGKLHLHLNRETGSLYI